MIQIFRVILIRECFGHPAGTIVDVAAGGDNYEGRWLALQPVEIASKWLVPWVDADRAITVKEAAHILGFRKGKALRNGTVTRYITKGRLFPAGILPSERTGGRAQRFISREAVWKMPFLKSGGQLGNRHAAYDYKKAKKGDDNDDV